MRRTCEANCVVYRMPILDGFEATKQIRALERNSEVPPGNGSVRESFELNGRIPIFAVSASLAEHQKDAMYTLGLDGWILKPIDFKRLRTLLQGVTDARERKACIYRPGCNWDAGGWLMPARSSTMDSVDT